MNDELLRGRDRIVLFTLQIKKSLDFIFWTLYFTFGSCRVHRLKKSITWHFQVTLIFVKNAAGLKEQWTVVLAARHVLVLENQTAQLLYSWRFSCYSAPIHWLVHGHMASNNETVSHQMPWACNIAKTMTSNGKQFTVTREMLTAVARDQRWPDVVAGISARFSKFAFVLFCYITIHLMTGPLGNSEFCFPRISMFPETSSREDSENIENFEILGKQNSLCPSGPVIKCYLLHWRKCIETCKTWTRSERSFRLMFCFWYI